MQVLIGGPEPWQQVAASSLPASLAHQRAGAETAGDRDLDERGLPAGQEGLRLAWPEKMPR